MTKKIKGLIALIITVCLLISCPITVRAEDKPEGEGSKKEEIIEDKKDKEEKNQENQIDQGDKIEKDDEVISVEGESGIGKFASMLAAVKTDKGDMDRVGNSGLVEYCGYGTNLFYVGTGGEVWNCFCIEPDKGYPREGHKIESRTEIKDKTVRKLCYYTYNAPGYNSYYNSNKSGLKTYYTAAIKMMNLSDTAKYEYALGHLMLAYASSESKVKINNWSYGLTDNYINSVKYIYKQINTDKYEDPDEDFKVYMVTMKEKDDQALLYWTYNPKYYGGFKIAKVYKDKCAEKNANYNLQAEYKVYSDEKCKNEAGVIKTDKNGFGRIDDLLPGTYYVKETKAAKNCGLDVNIHKVDVVGKYLKGKNYNIDQYPIVTSQEPVLYDPVYLKITKIDKYTGKSEPEGIGSLEDAQFEIKFYAIDNTKDYTSEDLKKFKPERSWVIKTKKDKDRYTAILDEEHLVSGDNLYFSDEKEMGLPLGVISIEEIKAPYGYSLKGASYVLNGDVISDNMIIARTDFESSIKIGNKSYSGDILLYESPLRGDIIFKKCDEEGKGIKNVKFTITCKETGESHDIYTDEKGEFSSKESDLFFISDNNINIKKEGSGALYFGTYVLKEESCEANRGKQLEDPITFTIEDETTYVIKDGKVKADHITNMNTSFISSKVVVPEINNNIMPGILIKEIQDVITYRNLKAGETYTLYGTAMVLNEDGSYEELRNKEGRAVSSSLSFTTDEDYSFSKYEKCGNVTVSFKDVDASGLCGKKLVFFEKLYLGDHVPSDGEEIRQYENYDKEDAVTMERVTFPICHEDINDKDQTIFIPECKTLAFNKETGGKLIIADKDQHVIDKISYSCLKPKEKYIITGWPVLKSTGECLKDDQGKEIKVSHEFVPEEEKGEVEVSFNIDTSDLIGGDIVFFEEIYIKDKLIAKHKDIKSDEQTVQIPEVNTYASDIKDGDKNIEGYNAAAVDKIYYSNLEAGKEYLVQGKMMVTVVKDNNKELINDTTNVTGETYFVPETKEGSTEVQFMISQREGDKAKNVVFYEKLYEVDRDEAGNIKKKTLVAVHEDINSKEQSLRLTPPDTPKTGDMEWILAGGVVFICGTVGSFIFYRRKENEEK